MAGFTPFQFSSRKLQEQTTSGLLGGISFGGTIANFFQTAFAWYEMWINPEKVSITTEYIQKAQQTAGSIVTYHYRQNNPTLSVSGACGWVMIESRSEEMSIGDSYTRATGFKAPGASESSTRYNRYLVDRGANLRNRGASDNTDNSPRKFLERLKNMADESMYFLDATGVEHYNTKFIKIYTKQFPQGVICEGYYTRFTIPEGSDDVQTINYEFEFTIERITPITLLERSLGMFGLGESQRQAWGGFLRSGY